jgi:hypothetical protein
MNSNHPSLYMIQPRFRDRTKRPGFAAITSVILICGIALISSTALAGVYLNEARETTMRGFAVQARASAYSCANIAMLRLMKIRSYTGNENISVDKVVCSINAVVSVGDARTVYAQATVNGLNSRIKVEIADVDQLFISSWTEIPPT